MRTPRLAPRYAVLWFSFASFALIGALQALYGPSFPMLRERFSIGVEQVSIVVSAQFIGSFLGIIASGLLLRALGYRRALVIAAAGFVAGVAAIGLAPTWGMVLAGAVLAGAGAGLLNVSCNLMVAVSFRPKAAPALNLINAVFGVGAVIGPLLVTALEPRFALPFLILGAGGLILLPWALRLPVPEVALRDRGAAPLALVNLGAFVLLYIFYVSVEVGVTSWETEYLNPHFGASAAAYTSLYWLAITVGRVLAAPLSARLRSHQFVLYASAATLLFMVAAHRVESAPVAFLLVGLSLSPIFPTALAWLTEVFPERSEQVTPIVVAGANLGPALTAPLIGRIVQVEGAAVIPTALSGLALALLVVVALLWSRTRSRAV